MKIQSEDLYKILDTGIALSKEKDRNKLFDRILDCSMDIVNCDAGTLYIVNDNNLEFKVMKTISLGIDRGKNGEVIDLPPVPLREENICAFSVLKKQSVNIENVYESILFDFSGPRKYDSLTGYHTRSMLTIPLLNQEDEAVGVLQLLNAMDAKGAVIPFDPEYERILLSLASQAAIAVSNILYMNEIKEQMWSFTEAMAEAIDQRTPYNATHIRKVAEYAGMVADKINEKHARGEDAEYFDTNRREQLVMAALLHDIGKIVTPITVMNKATRLEHSMHEIQMRFASFRDRYQIQWLTGKISEVEYREKEAKLQELLELAEDVNRSEFLKEETRLKLEEAFANVYRDGDLEIPYFTEEEKENLLIRKGTLTDAERKIMENHVIMTSQILDKVHFNRTYKDAPRFAGEHHEYIDGSGYPKQLAGEELSAETRILAVADICDALLASDRPYKKPKPREVAFAIMESMVAEGKLDGKYVAYLKECI
ncbi:MAG: HD domain-containing phosphohydrolase [Lachnospiraceae bacterium]